MERSQDYEPIILDLQKSQAVHQPKRYVLVSLIALSVISLLTATTFGVLYYVRSTSPKPNPTPRIITVATPRPAQTPTPLAEPTPAPPVVTPTPHPVVTEAPSEETGFLTLYSSPDNAEVVIDGKVLGRTPLVNHQLPAGTYTVTFAHDGTISQQTLTITAGKTTEYTHEFKGFASLRIRAIPSDSTIYLNGELAGRSPLQFDNLLPGTYTIVARKPGYASAEKTVVLEQDEQQEMLITLRRLGLSDTDTSAPTPVPEHPSDRLENTR